MKKLLFILLIMAFNSNTLMAKVVVTMPTVYMLVSPLLKDVDEVELLIQQGKCAHYYHLVPSDVRMVQTSHLTVWSGPRHEKNMERLVLKAPAVYELFKDSPYGWMSPMQSLKEIKALLPKLIKLYPAKADLLNENFISFSKELEALDHLVKEETADLRNASFIVTYPFLETFKKDYHLNIVFCILNSPTASFSPRLRNELIKILKKQQISAIIKDNHLPQGVLEKMLPHKDIPILLIDIEGKNHPIRNYRVFIGSFLSLLSKSISSFQHKPGN